MSAQIEVTPALTDYLVSVSLREAPLLAELRAETASVTGRSGMQISAHQGQFMRLLAELLGVRRGIEVGTFTGYSALCTAQALPTDGRLVCCDTSEEWTAMARRYWERAGVAERIELRLAPAAQTLDALLAEGGAGTYDWIFIDADKASYEIYYEKGMELLRSGGLVLVDNVLWGGDVLRDPASLDTGRGDDTLAIQAFNRRLHTDERITLSLVPIGDGLTLARKR